MSSKGRFNHPISLNEDQENIVNKAREIDDWSYAEMVVLAAETIITKKLTKKRK